MLDSIFLHDILNNSILGKTYKPKTFFKKETKKFTTDLLSILGSLKKKKNYWLLIEKSLLELTKKKIASDFITGSECISIG